MYKRASENRGLIVVATSAIRLRGEGPSSPTLSPEARRTGPPEIVRQHAAAVESPSPIATPRRFDRAPISSVCFCCGTDRSCLRRPMV